MAKSLQTGTVKRTVRINVPAETAWGVLGNISGLAGWATGVKDVSYLSDKRRGVGAIRSIRFDDGNMVEEHVVAWERGRHFTYIATEGLPLRAYVATISLRPAGRAVRVEWKSYLSSMGMGREQFAEFLASMGSFYGSSLKNLKKVLEDGAARARTR